MANIVLNYDPSFYLFCKIIQVYVYNRVAMLQEDNGCQIQQILFKTFYSNKEQIM